MGTNVFWFNSIILALFSRNETILLTPKTIQYQAEKNDSGAEVVKLINKVVFSGKKW